MKNDEYNQENEKKQLSKIKLLREEMKDRNAFESKIKAMYKAEYEEILPTILQIDEDEFFGNLNERIQYLFEELYSEDYKSIKKVLKILKDVEQNFYDFTYKIDLNLINKVINKSATSSPKKETLIQLKQHCPKSGEDPIHHCGTKFLPISEFKRGVVFVYCKTCNLVYFSHSILMFCESCQKEYLTQLTDAESKNYEPATWEKYHCGALINDQMRCINCSEFFFLRLQDKMLYCKNCKTEAKPRSIEWNCFICHTDFKSNAKVYNPLEFKLIKSIIKNALLYKDPAKPESVPCCKLDLDETEFFHKKECKGRLFNGTMDRKDVVVCEECKVITNYNNVLWTCPKCLKRFRQKNDKDNKENTPTKETLESPQVRKITDYKTNDDMKIFQLNEKKGSSENMGSEEEVDKNNENNKKSSLFKKGSMKEDSNKEVSKEANKENNKNFNKDNDIENNYNKDKKDTKDKYSSKDTSTSNKYSDKQNDKYSNKYNDSAKVNVKENVNDNVKDNVNDNGKDNGKDNSKLSPMKKIDLSSFEDKNNKGKGFERGKDRKDSEKGNDSEEEKPIPRRNNILPAKSAVNSPKFKLKECKQEEEESFASTAGKDGTDRSITNNEDDLSTSSRNVYKPPARNKSFTINKKELMKQNEKNTEKLENIIILKKPDLKPGEEKVRPLIKKESYNMSFGISPKKSNLEVQTNQEFTGFSLNKNNNNINDLIKKKGSDNDDVDTRDSHKNVGTRESIPISASDSNSVKSNLFSPKAQVNNNDRVSSKLDRNSNVNQTSNQNVNNFNSPFKKPTNPDNEEKSSNKFLVFEKKNSNVIIFKDKEKSSNNNLFKKENSNKYLQTEVESERASPFKQKEKINSTTNVEQETPSPIKKKYTSSSNIDAEEKYSPSKAGKNSSKKDIEKDYKEKDSGCSSSENEKVVKNERESVSEKTKLSPYKVKEIKERSSNNIEKDSDNDIKEDKEDTYVQKGYKKTPGKEKYKLIEKKDKIEIEPEPEKEKPIDKKQQKENERREAEKKEAERKEAERKEAERKLAEKKEVERKEAERRENERKEAELIKLQQKELEKDEKLKSFEVEDYTIISQIGEGSFGKIYLVENKHTKEKFSLKKIIAEGEEELMIFTKEFELVNSIRHPGILRILGSCHRQLDFTTMVLYILMEVAKFDWDKEIKSQIQARKAYSSDHIIKICEQTISGLSYLQQLNISHRDIKPQNILVFENLQYKVADFGEAKELTKNKQMNTLRGTEMFMSPLLFEALKYNIYDITHNAYKSDVYSLGLCLIYAISGNIRLINEFRNVRDDKQTLFLIKKIVNSNYNNKLIILLSKMLELKEEKRPDFIQLEAYFKGLFC